VLSYFAPKSWIRHGVGLALLAGVATVSAQGLPDSTSEQQVPVLTMESLGTSTAPDAAAQAVARAALAAPIVASRPLQINLPDAGVVSARRPISELLHVSFGQQGGLHGTRDALALKSSVALVLDQDTSEVLFSKNADAVLPIASLTKLMTALVVVEAALPLDEVLEITDADIDTEKGSRSHLSVGTRLTRGEMLHLALMSSENRAANALGRHYPGGLGAFVEAMNRKAQTLGMQDTRYIEPTGLSSRNQSSAPDLARLVNAASAYPLIRELSTSPEHRVAVGRRTLQFRNTNGLVRSKAWDIGLQKTGYIVEAGRCLVMQASMSGRKLIMVFLDSTGKYSRIGDAERVRHWIEHDGQLPVTSKATASSGARRAAPVARSARRRHAAPT
jgi:D-alanyl-D-alanine endopeptidase (penicillin-binding protein 7)